MYLGVFNILYPIFPAALSPSPVLVFLSARPLRDIVRSSLRWIDRVLEQMYGFVDFGARGSIRSGDRAFFNPTPTT